MEDYNKNPKYRIDRNRKKALKKYGLTPEAYDALLESQAFGCKICGRGYFDQTRHKYRSLAVDHDHKTGRVRGLLCSPCNRLLGFAEDNPTILLKAIQYLKGRL